MPQVLDLSIAAAYGQVCFSDQDSELPWDVSLNELHVGAEPSSLTVAVADEEPESEVRVEVFVGSDERPTTGATQKIFDGTLHLTRPGLLIFAPTGDETLVSDIAEGEHRVAIYRDDYPTSRLTVVIDG